MLRRTPSLALRAGLIFMSIYTTIFIIFLAVVLLTSPGDTPEDNYRGVRAAATFALGDIRKANGSMELAGDGHFVRLAAKNPSLWLLARSGEGSFVFGRPPAEAIRLFNQHGNIVRVAHFRVPDPGGALQPFMIRRYTHESGPLILAAGGADPATLTVQEALLVFGPEDALIALVVVALLGFLPILVALPFFARAIRPIAAEAASLRPEDLDRRLDETRAPRELLPLVRAFNSTLDRLAAELTRQKLFIANAAHELRTPLAVVALRVEALDEESAKQELRRGVDRLVHIVSQMLDIERLSLAGREKVPVDLVAAARDVVADLAPTAIKAGYELSLEAPDEPVRVNGDAHAISRAITNLVANSITHGGGAGQISVEVGPDRTIEVVDEGPGVPPGLQPRLFEPFSRGSQDAEGCGLGLHLTREVMRAHGGTVALVPKDRGATFRLMFGPGRSEDDRCFGESRPRS